MELARSPKDVKKNRPGRDSLAFGLFCFKELRQTRDPAKMAPRPRLTKGRIGGITPIKQDAAGREVPGKGKAVASRVEKRSAGRIFSIGSKSPRGFFDARSSSARACPRKVLARPIRPLVPTDRSIVRVAASLVEVNRPSDRPTAIKPKVRATCGGDSMRTETSTNSVSTSPRVRDVWQTLRRWTGDRSEATRRAALAIGLAIVALAAVYAAMPSEPTATEWLFAGRRFSPDKIEPIVAALADADIRAVVDSHRVGVPRDRVREARAALKQAKIAPPSFEEILRSGGEQSSFFDTPDQLQNREDRAKEQALAALIEQQCDGVVSAHVVLTPLAAPNGFNPSRVVKAKAVVTLETEDDRPLSDRSVRKVLSLLRGFTRFEIAAESVGLLDKQKQYLDAGNLALLRSVLNGAHREDLADSVRANLPSEGVEIFVRFDADPDAESPSGIDENSNPRTFVNRPADLADAKPESTRAVTDLGAHDPGKAFVTVRLNRRADAERDSFSKTEPAAWTLSDDEIKERVARALPQGETGAVSIERVDEPVRNRPTSPPIAAPAPVPSTRGDGTKPEWLPYAIAGAALGLVALAAGGSLLMGWRRRPALRSAEPAGARTRFDREEASTSTARPAPSERVRELVRRDPEAAAGVLQRWIGQGGHVE